MDSLCTGIQIKSITSDVVEMISNKNIIAREFFTNKENSSWILQKLQEYF